VCAANETPRQEWIRLAPPHHELQERIRRPDDRNHNGERELKAGRVELVRVVAKDEHRGGRDGVAGDDAPIDEIAAQHDRSHQRSANARGIQPSDRGVEEERGDDQPNRPAPRDTHRGRHDPEQVRDDRHVQPGDCEEVQRSVC
jgi:hypothetical protein